MANENNLCYYEDNDNYPQIIRAIKQRLVIYFSILLYNKESITDAKKRFVLADITNTEDDAFPKRMIQTNQSNFPIPFSAFNIGELSIDDPKKNYFGKSGFWYSNQLDAYVSMTPMKLDYHFYHFFHPVPDYLRARTMLSNNASSLIRLYVPCMINGKDTYFPVTVNMEITKGQYATSFLTWLEKGQLNDIYTKITINYYDIILNERMYSNADGLSVATPENGLGKESVEIYPIESVRLILEKEGLLTPIENLIITG